MPRRRLLHAQASIPSAVVESKRRKAALSSVVESPMTSRNASASLGASAPMAAEKSLRNLAATSRLIEPVWRASYLAQRRSTSAEPIGRAFEMPSRLQVLFELPCVS